MLADRGEASAFGVSGEGLDENGIDVVLTASGGKRVNLEVVVREGQIAALHGGGKVHGVGQASAKHGVHLVRDVHKALLGLELGGESAEVAKGGVGETGRGQDT